jgi:O-antigen/teichoic acid export membrane protein
LTTIRKIAKNTGVLFAGQILSYVLGFIYVIYVARYLGAESFGILTLALAFTGIFGILADLGLSRLIVRDVSRDKSLTGKYLGNSLSMKLILALFMLLVTILVLNLFNYPEEIINVVYILTISVIFTSFSQLFYSIYQIFQKMEYQAIGLILNGILILGSAFLGMLFRLDVTGFAILYLIATIFVLLYNIIVCSYKFMIPGIKFNFSFWKMIISNSIFFGLADVFIVIYFNIDSVMLSLIVGEAVVGWYNAAYRLIFVLMFIPTVLVVTLFPLMSKQFEYAKEILKMEYEKSFKYLFVISIILLVYGLLFADKIILMIYGNDYFPAIGALQVLIFVIPIIFLTNLFGNLMAAINMQRVVTLVAGANAFLNIVLNLILIPKYSFIGAGIATVLTEGLGFVLMYYYISKYFSRISVIENILKPVFCGLIIAIIIYFFKSEINWILAGVIGLSTYVLLLYALKIINNEDFKLFKQVFK